MKFLITFLTASLLMASSLEAMEKTISDEIGISNSTPEASYEQIPSVAALQRQINVLAAQNKEFSSSVLAQMATMSEMLKRLAEQQASNSQPKKRTRRAAATQPTASQVPTMSAQSATIAQIHNNMKPISLTQSTVPLVVRTLNPLTMLLQEAKNHLNNKNYDTAVQILTHLCHQEQDLAIQAEAWFYLGDYYYFDVRNYAEAEVFYNKAADDRQIHNLSIKAEALMRSATCCLHKVSPDLNLARQYLKKVFDLAVDPAAKEMARSFLAQISSDDEMNQVEIEQQTSITSDNAGLQYIV